MVDSVLEVQNIKLPDSGGTTGADIFTSTGNVPTIASGVVFPAGHVIQTQVLQWNETSVMIGTSNTSYTNVGISGSFQTLKSSSDSFLMFEFNSGMAEIGTTGAVQTDFCLTSSDITTHFNANSLSDTLYRHWFEPNIAGYSPIIYKAFFKSGTRVTTNLSSYSAGDTLYLRIFCKTAGGTFNIVHSNSNYYLLMQEIAL